MVFSAYTIIVTMSCGPVAGSDTASYLRGLNRKQCFAPEGLTAVFSKLTLGPNLSSLFQKDCKISPISVSKFLQQYVHQRFKIFTIENYAKVYIGIITGTVNGVSDLYLIIISMPLVSGLHLTAKQMYGVYLIQFSGALWVDISSCQYSLIIDMKQCMYLQPDGCLLSLPQLAIYGPHWRPDPALRCNVSFLSSRCPLFLTNF